ncbi:FecR family protein [Labilibaculum antarcticum]|uniref:Anti-sigma factor n=1 Tax=Labilibaculum antarcticum TaxID=1717717 RepID=A0A1Y1CDP4_9BACT|nr:FecR domain-containing protein [Labilibaculum antarcticum]BAX78454.1 hypothetical protein ALGA_0059 [Labilibaculum antarcticum]
MDKEKLIRKILNGESISDSKELLDWVNQSKSNEKEYIRYKNVWALLQRGKEMSNDTIAEGFLNVKSNAIVFRKRNVFKIYSIIKYAAIILVALLSGYLFNTIQLKSEIVMNEIAVPKGNRTSVFLSDGTKVWLSNGTKLIYPEKFNGKIRNVELQGEGFFEVAHDTKHPFVVTIGNNRVKVLGTKFSVHAYPDDNEVRVDLITGKVQFDFKSDLNAKICDHYILKPSHRIVFNKTTRNISDSHLKDNFHNYWMNGIYEFEEESFASLAKKIERIYNVQIIFEDESLKNRRFTGTFKIDDNVYTLMEVFESASGKAFSYRQERDRIFIERTNKKNVKESS